MCRCVCLCARVDLQHLCVCLVRILGVVLHVLEKVVLCELQCLVYVPLPNELDELLAVELDPYSAIKIIRNMPRLPIPKAGGSYQGRQASFDPAGYCQRSTGIISQCQCHLETRPSLPLVPPHPDPSSFFFFSTYCGCSSRMCGNVSSIRPSAPSTSPCSTSCRSSTKRCT